MFDQIKCVYQTEEITVWTCTDAEGEGYAGCFDTIKKWTITGTLPPAGAEQKITTSSWG